MITKRRSTYTGFLTAFCVLICDMASKWVMIEKIGLLERPPIAVTPFFNLVAVWNPGVSFGMFASYNQPLILIALSLVIIAVLFVWLARNGFPMVAIALGLVIGGATGNIIDRLRYGKVFDFLDFHLAGWHWPAFNIADSGIVIGVVVLCIHGMFFEKKASSKGTPE